MKSTELVLAAAALTLALGACAADDKAMASKQTAAMEKCFGVAKAGGNDCKSGAHACAGHATVNADPASFVMVPAGSCAKLAGGKVG